MVGVQWGEPVRGEQHRQSGGGEVDPVAGYVEVVPAAPPIRACQLARFGTPTSSAPRGATQSKIRATAAPGSSRCSSTCHSATASTDPASISHHRSRPAHIGRPAGPAADGSIPNASNPAARAVATNRPRPAPASSSLTPGSTSGLSSASRRRSNARSTRRHDPCKPWRAGPVRARLMERRRRLAGGHSRPAGATAKQLEVRIG